MFRRPQRVFNKWWGCEKYICTNKCRWSF